MDGDRLLLAIELVRQARPAGFCPACRVLMKALDARQELAKPTVAALVVLAVAGVAWAVMVQQSRSMAGMDGMDMGLGPCPLDRKSTRLNSSHLVISYAVFCLKKKN